MTDDTNRVITRYVYHAYFAFGIFFFNIFIARAYHYKRTYVNKTSWRSIRVLYTTLVPITGPTTVIIYVAHIIKYIILFMFLYILRKRVKHIGVNKERGFSIRSHYSRRNKHLQF